MNLKSSLLYNAIAGVFVKAGATITRLLMVPLFLHFLGVEGYGNWIVLSSLLSWLSIANVGLGSVGTNEMSMAMARGDTVQAQTAFSSAISLLWCVSRWSFPVILVVSLCFPWRALINVGEERSFELAIAVLLLSVTVFLSFFAGIYSSRIVAAGKAHISIQLSGLRAWLDLLASTIALYISQRFDLLAFALTCSGLAHVMLIDYVGKCYADHLRYSESLVDRQMSTRLLKLGLAFQAFPLGNALVFQGSILIVQVMLGATEVAVFSTARTLVRTANQSLEFVNQAVWPEMARLIAVSDLRRAALLHRISVIVSISIASIVLLAIGLFGERVFLIWTDGKLSVPTSLLLLSMVPIPLNALWYTSSVVHAASNQHSELASRYLAATAYAFVCCIPLTYFFGLPGTAFATVIVDLLLIGFVINRSFLITNDSWRNCVVSILNNSRQFSSFLRRYL